MKKVLMATLIILISVVPVLAADGVINVQSDVDVQKTADRLERILREKGMTIFKRINHSDIARRHDGSGCGEVIEKIKKALSGITKAAATR